MPRHNTGTIKKRPDTGRFRAQLTIGYNDKGNPIRISRDFDTKPQADYWLSQQKIAHQNKTVNASEITVQSFSEQWLESRKTREAKTQQGDIYTLKKHVLPHLGRIRLQELEPLHIQKMLNELQKTTTKGMANDALRVIKTMCNDAMRLRILERSPTQLIRPLPVQKKPIPVWTKEEVKRVLDYLKRHEWQDWIDRYVHVGLTTAMRRGELLGLTWADIDFDELSIKVQNSVIYISGKYIHKNSAKTEAGHRKIYFDVVTRDVLYTQKVYADMLREAHLKSIFNEITKHPKDYKGIKLATFRHAYKDWKRGLVFPSLVGTPQTEKRLSDKFKRLCAAAEVPKIRLYDLRATWATHAIESKKISPKTVANRLGHTDMAFTLQRYSRPGDAEQRLAAVEVGELFE